ncbi:MAG: alcohol dehydrogenase catalytic domain-containing protein [Chloroflexi bacterium]|nr:alcohol dehydrogenase catalytic domain-containing protein [Chloroflexota bacterium]
MKAAVYTALKTIEFQDRPMPKAGPGEVVVKIKYCGICRTDVDIYFEGLLPPGIVLGHENVGTVAEVGKGVDGWEVGSSSSHRGSTISTRAIKAFKRELSAWARARDLQPAWGV